MPIIAWGNQKGGVGKSTSCAATSFLLANQGYSILCVDTDPQGSLIQIITGENKENYSDYNLMVAIEENDQDSHIVEVTDKLHIIPSNRYLSNFNEYAEETYEDPFEQSQILKKFLKPIRFAYDFIMIDLPPGLETITINGLAAADSTIAVLQPHPLAYDALLEYIDTIESIKGEGINENLDILGILLTLVKRGQNVDEQFIQLAKDEFRDLMFKAMVYNRTRLSQYPSIGLQTKSNVDNLALRPYKDLVKELLARVR